MRISTEALEVVLVWCKSASATARGALLKLLDARFRDVMFSWDGWTRRWIEENEMHLFIDMAEERETKIKENWENRKR